MDEQAGQMTLISTRLWLGKSLISIKEDGEVWCERWGN